VPPSKHAGPVRSKGGAPPRCLTNRATINHVDQDTTCSTGPLSLQLVIVSLPSVHQVRGERDRFLIDLADLDATLVIANGRASLTVIIGRAAAEALRQALARKLDMPGRV
jgi:hypothetical protein